MSARLPRQAEHSLLNVLKVAARTPGDKVAICSGDHGNWALGGAFLPRLRLPQQPPLPGWPQSFPKDNTVPRNIATPPPAQGASRVENSGSLRSRARRQDAQGASRSPSLRPMLMRLRTRVVVRAEVEGGQIKCEDQDDLVGTGEGPENKAAGRLPRASRRSDRHRLVHRRKQGEDRPGLKRPRQFRERRKGTWGRESLSL